MLSAVWSQMLASVGASDEGDIGVPNKDIATRLFVSPRTIQSHLRHVYGKLDVTTRVQLAKEAVGHG
jgi:DNA-binding NarL/FixJ family response regulator